MTSAVHKWKTFWSLTPAERGIARSAAAGLVTTWFGLRAFGFSRWQRMLERRISRVPAKTPAAPAVSAHRIAQLQEAAALDLFLSTSCLERSLALWSLLQRRGFPAELKFGARKQSGKFEAHAWVELNGVALNNPADEQRNFAPFEGAIASLETRAK
jgi:Transglutaminase-like superfamily